MSQLAQLRQYFDAPGRKLTAVEALYNMGIGRLAPRVLELEQEGYQFAHTMIPVTKRDGSTARVAEYVLIAAPAANDPGGSHA